MSKATVCDRCGEVFKGDPELRIATDTTDGPSAKAKTVERETNSGITQGIATPVSDPKPYYGVLRWFNGDLCKDCAVSFNEWWDE